MTRYTASELARFARPLNLAKPPGQPPARNWMDDMDKDAQLRPIVVGSGTVVGWGYATEVNR